MLIFSNMKYFLFKFLLLRLRVSKANEVPFNGYMLGGLDGGLFSITRKL